MLQFLLKFLEQNLQLPLGLPLFIHFTLLTLLLVIRVFAICLMAHDSLRYLEIALKRSQQARRPPQEEVIKSTQRVLQ
eukprot:7129708-Pyramimonas_sp.AAC.1